ncbi:MAG: lactonase family protein [Planctomycetota bacterium]|jgi:6-phosphogluconolactonase
MSMKSFITAVFSFAALSTVSAKPVRVYFGTYTSGQNSSKGIYRSIIDSETGKISNPVLATVAKNPSFLEIHPNRKFLYAVSEVGGSGGVSAYVIDRNTGDLTLLNQRPSPRRQQGPHAHSINVSPDNRFAFVADLGTDKVMIYRLDIKKGTIIKSNPPYAKLKPGAGPRHFSFHPNGKYAYVINELDCTVTAFTYEPTSGALSDIQTITTLPKDFNGSNTCAEVRVHPSGKFLYGSNRGHDSIAVYRIDLANGKLTFVEHETIDIKTPRNFNIDPKGKFCLVANQGTDSVVVFRINQRTGALEPTGHKISIGRPVCVRFLRLNR